MNKVIRTARISDHPVRLGVSEDEEIESAQADVVGLDEQADVVEPSGAPEGEEEGEAEDGEEMLVGDGGEEPEGEEPPPQDDAQEEPTFSALAVETLVEERLKEFEERFQAEKEEAYRAGFEDGRTDGLKGGQEQSRDEIDRFQSIVEDLTTQWKDLYKNADMELVELVLAVARKIIGSAAEVRQEPVLLAVQECLGYLQDKLRVVVKVHPDDLETVRRHRNDWLESLEGIEQLLIEGDSGISRGGCVVETPKGDVDAQIEERLERLRAVLIDEIRSEGEAE